ncbi:hypothetical protein AVEN_31612-1, partial [Araneus ventricosus]
MFNSLDPAGRRIPIFVHENGMESCLFFQKFQDDDGEVWATKKVNKERNHFFSVKFAQAPKPPESGLYRMEMPKQ